MSNGTQPLGRWEEWGHVLFHQVGELTSKVTYLESEQKRLEREMWKDRLKMAFIAGGIGLGGGFGASWIWQMFGQ